MRDKRRLDRINLATIITLLATATLSLVLVGMVAALMIGLFDNKVDNTKIFEMVMPAFQTIVGGFIGLVTGIKLGGDGSGKE